MPTHAKKKSLSKRELQVVSLATEGLTDKEIAARLGLQITSIKSHWARIRTKLQAVNRAQVIAKQVSLMNGFVQIPGKTPDIGILREQWQHVTEMRPVIVMTFGMDGIIQAVSGFLVDAEGERLVGMHFLDLIPKEDHAEAIALFERITQHGERASYTNRILLPGGDQVIFTGIEFPLRTEEGICGAISMGQYVVIRE